MSFQQAAKLRSRLRAWAGPRVPAAVGFALCAAAMMVIAAPLALERAIQGVQFSDR
jgi:hypothetical protein